MGSNPRSPQTTAPQQPEPSSSPPWVLIGGVLAIAALGVLLLYPTDSSQQVVDLSDSAATATQTSDTSQAAAPDPEPAVAPEPVEIVVPPADAPQPPYPFIPNVAPRPANVITDAYEFAGRRPDVVEFVPCFCGCESAGHRANAHCFVRARNADGTVAEWEPHGLGCAVCIDVAIDAARLTASGASVGDVRDAVEAKYAPRFPRMTPTPHVPAN